MIGIPTTADDEVAPTTRAIWSDVLAYWEPRRLIYNGLLLTVVLVQLVQQHWWRELLTPAALARLLVSAAAANLCYSVAHGLDMAIQHSDFRHFWRRHRSWLFVVGCWLGVAISFLTFREFVLGIPQQ